MLELEGLRFSLFSILLAPILHLHLVAFQGHQRRSDSDGGYLDRLPDCVFARKVHGADQFGATSALQSNFTDRPTFYVAHVTLSSFHHLSVCSFYALLKIINFKSWDHYRNFALKTLVNWTFCDWALTYRALFRSINLWSLTL